MMWIALATTLLALTMFGYSFLKMVNSEFEREDMDGPRD